MPVLSLLLTLFLPSIPHSQEPATRCIEPESRQFDFWIGSWTSSNQQRSPSRYEDPSWFETGTFRSDVYPVLDGCAILEISKGELVFGSVYGASLRAWVPEEQQWVVLNHWSVAGARPTFTSWSGRMDHGRIVGYADSDNPREFSRYLFTDVTDDSFRWESATSRDSMNTWRPDWTIRGARIPILEAEPRFPFGGDPLCGLPGDDWMTRGAGEWSGTAASNGDTLSVTRRSMVLNAGCLVFDHMRIGNDEVALLWSREAESGNWIRYEFSTARRSFVRTSGAVAGQMIELAGTDGDDRRINWWMSDSDIRITTTRSDGADTVIELSRIASR